MPEINETDAARAVVSDAKTDHEVATDREAYAIKCFAERRMSYDDATNICRSTVRAALHLLHVVRILQVAEQAALDKNDNG